METLNVIIQISVLLLVAFLIGIATEWYYWRTRYRKMKSEFKEQLTEKNRIIATRQSAIDKLNALNEDLNQELSALKEKAHEHSGDIIP